MAVERRVAAYLELANEDLNAAEILARLGNQFAAYHVQQGIEKLIKALLLQRGVEAGIEHRLENLADRLPTGDPCTNGSSLSCTTRPTPPRSGTRPQQAAS